MTSHEPQDFDRPRRKRRNPTLIIVAVMAVLFAVITAFAVLAAQNAPAEHVAFTDEEKQLIAQHSPLPPLPVNATNRLADDPAAAHFGQYLFFDPRLSSDGNVSCATCHDPRLGFSDGKQFAEGLGRTTRHAQPLFNVAWNRWMYWSGAADSLWSQALQPIERPEEMGSSRTAIVHLIAGDAELRLAYEKIYGELPDISDPDRFPQNAKPTAKQSELAQHQAWTKMTADDREIINRIFVNVGKAVAGYERKIVSRDAPFDTFVEGLLNDDDEKRAALSLSAQRGLQIFIGEGNCRTCHTGPNFTDGEFHSIGVPPLAGGIPRDAGRFAGIDELTKNPFNAAGKYSDDPTGPLAERLSYLLKSSELWGQFKTPSLRSVALSPPYMHQGQFASLSDVINYYSLLNGMVQMGHHQEQVLEPLGLDDVERADLEAFLRSLTGAPLPGTLLKQPDAPMPDSSTAE